MPTKISVLGCLGCVLGLVSTAATAGPDPITVRGETIEIHGRAPIAVPPKPLAHYAAIAPSYSDYAIEHDTWAKAWVLLDIDAHGAVTRMKMLKHPGAGLELFAVHYAFAMKFEPARDAAGNPSSALLVTAIEWPSYWWMVAQTGLATAIPDNVDGVACRGGGPLHLGSIHPVYRDCTPPDLKAIDREPWITHSHT
jgi:hypothetical protein